MGGTRLEPPSKSLEKALSIPQRSNSVATSGELDSDLALLLDIWPALPAEVRKQIIEHTQIAR
jgi:hypothetical protein